MGALSSLAASVSVVVCNWLRGTGVETRSSPRSPSSCRDDRPHSVAPVKTKACYDRRHISGSVAEQRDQFKPRGHLRPRVFDADEQGFRVTVEASGYPGVHRNRRLQGHSCAHRAPEQLP